MILDRLLHRLLCLSATLACLALAWFFWQANERLEDLPATLKAYKELPEAAKGDLAAFIKLTGEDLKALGAIVKNSDAAMQNLTKQVSAQTEALGNASTAIAQLVNHTDASLNGPKGVLPALGDVVVHFDADTQKLGPVLDNARQGTANLVALTAPEQYQPTLHDLQVMSAETAGIATDAHRTTTVIANMAEDSQKKKHRILNYLGMAGKVLEFLYYAKHQ